MNLMDLSFGDSSERPPWEQSGVGADSAPTPFSSNPVDSNRIVPRSGPMNPDLTEQDAQELEIFSKAERFKAIHLLSGNGMSDEELQTYVSKHYGVLGLQRLKLAKFIMVSLGYKPSPDVLLMLSCTNRARIVIATAGAGKTTSLQFDLLISKMLDKALGVNELAPEVIEGTSVSVPKILYLNYNKHNVKPILDKHVSLCAAVNKLLKSEDAIDDGIESSTVHAFCHRWLKAYSMLPHAELPELKIISDDKKSEMWEAIVTPRWKKFYGEASMGVDFASLDELYNFKTESMLDWPEFFLSAKFVDLGLKPEFVQSCIKKYDSMKKQMQLLDFTDYLILMTEVLKKDPEYKKELQRSYPIIIADENQDFTRLMNELLIQLYDPAYNRIIVVGDPDQTIYAFKGVSPDNVVTLAAALPDMELLGLDTNYRCPDGIVDAAKSILDLNILRFKKPIETVRTGGRILTHPFNQGESQDAAVIQFLNRIGSSNWSDTVITYRNNISSFTIAEELYYARIPFTILDDRRPFSNPIFRQLTRALRALQEKDNYELNTELYRFMPLTKDQWSKILEYNRKLRRNHLHDLQVSDSLPHGTMEALRTLVQISDRIDTQPTCDFIRALVKLYRTYYLDFMIKAGGGKSNDTDNYLLYLDRAVKFYSRQMTYSYLMAELREKNRDNPAGVVLSTFHGLKGLEFNYVIAVDFSEALFPNYYGIEQRYSKNTALEEKESENRLCYVLVTRVIKELHLFYPALDPSLYVGILTKSGTSDVASSESEELTLGTISTGSAMDSRASFIQRILGNRG